MEIAERQQPAAQAALEGLAVERAALELERQALAREVGLLAQRMSDAVHLAVSQSLAEAAGHAAETVERATEPLLGVLSSMTRIAGDADMALRRVVQ